MGDIRTFWDWLVANLARLDEDEVQEALAQRLKELGVSGWEMGGGETDRFLALSIGSADELARARAILADAPNMPGWRFLAGKPRKDWFGYFTWNGVEIDASAWRCVVFAYDDGMAEIVFIDPAIPDPLKDATQQILEFVVESELGQLRALEKVCGVAAESVSDEVRAEDAIPVLRLSAAL
ncbi:hypothetical protein [uncultured Caulobacter sp.]|uniref:hypothetical protein n=1 Tax=uncultured Caulobacter sp. TaxID=158749 RepID=UPI00262A5EA4|nr:hypothetical protein [uncultured Caulobacter sp.]